MIPSRARAPGDVPSHSLDLARVSERRSLVAGKAKVVIARVFAWATLVLVLMLVLVLVLVLELELELELVLVLVEPRAARRQRSRPCGHVHVAQRTAAARHAVPCAMRRKWWT